MCTKCERVKLSRWVRKGKDDENSPQVKKRTIDATPARHRYEGFGGMPHDSKSVNAQVSTLSDAGLYASGEFDYGLTNIRHNVATTNNSPVKRHNQQASRGKMSTTSPNLIHFLETTQSKDRLLLTKAYNVNLRN